MRRAPQATGNPGSGQAMRFPHLFIERPILATVVSVLITLLGAIAYLDLSVAQYPETAPPTIQISATYPGASAEVAGLIEDGQRRIALECLDDTDLLPHAA